MKKFVCEDEVEQQALALFSDLGYSVINGLDIQPDGLNPERKDFKEVVLLDRLRSALRKINAQIPNEALDYAIRKITSTDSANLVENNKAFHKFLIEGVPVEYKKDRIIHDVVKLFNFEKPENNEFLAVNQFTIIEVDKRRPDVILFVNGLPLVVIELKNPADKNAKTADAYAQLKDTYPIKIPSLFRFNQILIISDWFEAQAGTITSNADRFTAWKTINAEKPKGKQAELETLIKGMLNKNTLIDLIQNFTTFVKDNDKQFKIIASYHQYDAVNSAIESTVDAISTSKKGGLVWHTQGSGKSYTMVFYTGKLVKKLNNPTVIVLTDRNDLDNQLFSTFTNANELGLLRNTPKQVESREDLKNKLKVASGGVIFTTIQKFLPDAKFEKYPLLSDRGNIVVIADEAHRTQYDFVDGFAKHMRDALPNATFIGFTGTPIEKEDRSTLAVFGDYVSVYDMQQAIEDKVTVPINYESKLAKIDIKPEERPKLDLKFDEVTESEEVSQREKLKSKWAALEKVIGSPERVKRLAKDIVEHFEEREKVLNGKAMIVCMSRRICADLYNEIIKIRPEWHSNDDKNGAVKVVMTGSAKDPIDWQKHIRNKENIKKIEKRFKNPEDKLKLVIVRDMWLTGFDVPSMHTMYLDKPMQGHTLMQAIARVNRVFKDKPGGLVVDYIGIAQDLRKALTTYSSGNKKENLGGEKEKAIKLMKEKYEVVRSLFHGFDYESLKKNKLKAIVDAEDFICRSEDTKTRFLQEVTLLTKAFALSTPSPECREISDDLALFQAIRTKLVKNTLTQVSEQSLLNSAIRQLVSKAIVSDRVIDIFEAAGIDKPNFSVLSEKFLSEVKHVPQKNLAFEMLKKLLNDEINIRMKKNVVQGRSFRELLEKTIKKYTNRNIETAEVIHELIEIANKMRTDDSKAVELNLDEAEKAFYDALTENKTVVKVMGDEKLMIIAREVAETIRTNYAIDWIQKESVRAKLRLSVKKVLKKYGYPPESQEQATQTVIQQAELTCTTMN